MSRITETNIDKLIPDDKNFNKGTEYGDHLLENSLSKLGMGRSVLLDKNNRIIAGNKTIEKAASCGFSKVVVVETEGDVVVAVKRKDIDLDSKTGRELALADNSVGKVNLCFDNDLVMQQADVYGFDPQDWGLEMPIEEQEEEEPEEKTKESKLIVTCDDETRISLLFSELQNRGFKCNLTE